MYIKIGTPPKKHGISWVRPYGNAASTIAVGSWTPGVGPPESSESCAAALKTASKWNFSPNSSFISYSFVRGARIYRLVNVGNRSRDASVECRIYDVELNGRFETTDKNIQFGAHWLASLCVGIDPFRARFLIRSFCHASLLDALFRSVAIHHDRCMITISGFRVLPRCRCIS